MNKQIILAAVAGSAAAADAEECKNDFVNQVEANLKALKAQLATAETDQKPLEAAVGTDAAKGTAWAAYAKAKKEREDHEARMKTYLDQHAAAKKAEDDNNAAEIKAGQDKAAAEGKVAALNAKIGDATKGAKGALATKDQAIAAQVTEVTDLTAQTTRHSTEHAAQKAAETALEQAVTAAKKAITDNAAALAALKALRTTRAYQSTDGANCTCTWKETINTSNAQSHQPGPWAWSCKNGNNDCNAAVNGVRPDWKGLDALEKAALDAYYGSTGSRDNNKHSTQAQAAVANSKQKIYDDALATADQVVAQGKTQGDFDKRSQARVTQLLWGVKRALAESGCIANSGSWNTKIETSANVKCGTNLANADPWTAKSWDMACASLYFQGKVTEANKTAGGAFGNLKPFIAANANATRKGQNDAATEYVWSTDFHTAVTGLADKSRDIQQAKWQWEGLKTAITTNESS